MSEILLASGVVGGLGLLFGILLTVAANVFAVEVNPLVTKVREVLPGANCGACGYPGCDGLAEAIAEGKAPVNACPVGGAPLAEKLSEIMGTKPPKSTVRTVAQVVCRGGLDRCKTKFEYEGIQDCLSASLVADGYKACSHACLGLGTCVNACKFGAITIDEERKIAVVDTEKCTNCGMCVQACPRDVLALQPEKMPVRLLCREAEKGKVVREKCNAGCIGCGLCSKSCKFGVITMVDNLPQFDMDKCVGCMVCAEVCPTWAIWGDFENRNIAQINAPECIGCGICKKTCQFEAISGEMKHPHQITAACTGCGQCVTKCPKKCISLTVRTHERDRYAKVGTSNKEQGVQLH